MADTLRITDDFHVAPQITAEDIPALKEAGFSIIIANRPDDEVPPPLYADKLAEVAQANGMTFLMAPLGAAGLQPGLIETTLEAMGMDGNVLAYCRSGTRSSQLYAIARAARGDAIDSIIEDARGAGFDVAAMTPLLRQQQAS